MGEVKSPCKRKCNYDYKTKMCPECYRMIDEIMAWPHLNDEERLFVLKKAEKRKAEKGK